MATNELENRIRKINLIYRKNKQAVIQKLEVPIRITKIGAVATLSTVDFYGVFSYYKGKKKIGKAIAFDAKETESLTSFPLANIHQHQLEFLKLWVEVGGEGFFFIHFKKVHSDRAYITPVELISRYWNNSTGRKSIPLAEFRDEWLVPIENYLEHLNGSIKKSSRSDNDNESGRST